MFLISFEKMFSTSNFPVYKLLSNYHILPFLPILYAQNLPNSHSKSISKTHTFTCKFLFLPVLFSYLILVFCPLSLEVLSTVFSPCFHYSILTIFLSLFLLGAFVYYEYWIMNMYIHNMCFLMLESGRRRNQGWVSLG